MGKDVSLHDKWMKRNQELEENFNADDVDVNYNLQKNVNMTYIDLNALPSDEQAKFLKEEYGVDDVNALSDAAYNELYDKLCDIEVDETCKAIDSEILSDLGMMAEGLVTYMGNQFIEGGRRWKCHID